jgi:hypothetical protein
MGTLLGWIESTTVATGVANSARLTAWLSAVHLLGFTFVTSGALVYGLRSLGLLFPQLDTFGLARHANRLVVTGLAISVFTGALLFAARATSVGVNGTFQLKMLLLIAAAGFHFAVQRVGAPPRPALALSAVGLCLWLGVAVTACAFILLE